jgi:anti-anti-sigma regulatory factor
VGVIIKTRKIMKNNDGQVLLVNLQPQIEKVLEIIKALPDQRIFNNIEELDGYLDRMQKKVIREG